MFAGSDDYNVNDIDMFITMIKKKINNTRKMIIIVLVLRI